LQVLRDRQVPGVFFDNGIRVDANPQLAAFQVREGHVQLNHTYTHPHLDRLSAAAVVEEVRRTEKALATAGAPLTFAGIRPPFNEADERTRLRLTALGYTVFTPADGRIGTDDYDPALTAAQIRDAIVDRLRPGGIIGLHDGAIDTPAGAATVAALPQIIDAARERGYAFGVVDASGQVVAGGLAATGGPIPPIVHPVPYLPLVFPGPLPRPYVMVV